MRKYAYIEHITNRAMTELSGWPLESLYEIAKLTNYIRLKNSGIALVIALDKDGVLHIREEEDDN